jgi:hypothetical protein
MQSYENQSHQSSPIDFSLKELKPPSLFEWFVQSKSIVEIAQTTLPFKTFSTILGYGKVISDNQLGWFVVCHIKI